MFLFYTYQQLPHVFPQDVAARAFELLHTHAVYRQTLQSNRQSFINLTQQEATFLSSGFRSRRNQKLQLILELFAKLSCNHNITKARFQHFSHTIMENNMKGLRIISHTL